MSALGVVASGPAADAIASAVPALVEARFASGLFAEDATLWGKEAESGMAARVVEACQNLRSAGTSQS